ncbi:MAG TPA: nuclear transport factor 2 family protein, partial [Methylibium sp.]
PEGEPDLIKGTDFVLLDGGLLKAVTGFLDKVPAGA